MMTSNDGNSKMMSMYVTISMIPQKFLFEVIFMSHKRKGTVK